MPPEATAIGRWETFYVIVGSSGGALTGLLFVVVALAADRIRAGTSQGLSAFTSPSLFHFCIVLFMSAAVVMPHAGLGGLAVILVGSALVGGTVTLLAIIRIAKFEHYRPVAEDWIWHGAIPTVAYIGLLVAGIMLRGSTDTAMSIVGAASLGLLFVGVHNAWDVAIYSALYMPRNQETPPPPPT